MFLVPLRPLVPIQYAFLVPVQMQWLPPMFFLVLPQMIFFGAHTQDPGRPPDTEPRIKFACTNPNDCLLGWFPSRSQNVSQIGPQTGPQMDLQTGPQIDPKGVPKRIPKTDPQMGPELHAKSAPSCLRSLPPPPPPIPGSWIGTAPPLRSAAGRWVSRCRSACLLLFVVCCLLLCPGVITPSQTPPPTPREGRPLRSCSCAP